MLNRQDNELLTRVGPETAMGAFFRRHWLPFLLANELVADAAPTRVRLLGESLVPVAIPRADVHVRPAMPGGPSSQEIPS